MKPLLYTFILSFTLSTILFLTFIPLLKKKRIGQPIYKYVDEHKEKSGTPTMGGMFFILPSIISFFIFGRELNRESLVAVSIGFSFAVVGFLDDFIKIKSGDNEGLKPYQKIIFQTGIAVVSGIFALKNGITDFNIPFSKESVYLGVWTLFIDAFIFIATTNCVNLTDGLDGLAASTSLYFLFFISIIISLKNGFSEINGLSLLCFSLIGGLAAFLIFNTNKASIFMGDTGSLSLGGFIAAISIFSSNGFLVPVLGFPFVFSGISVIIQVLYYKLKKRRIFLKAPFHHHLQLKGLSENKIVFIYSVFTVLTGVISLIFYI